MIRSSYLVPRGLLFLVAFFLLPFASARGALDPETTRPYHLQVVLHIAENRLLTPLFRDLVERQLRDSLRAALGDLAQVEIVRDHPLLKEVEEKGLKAALDGYTSVSDTKTHFVLIDFVNGRYEIQARQYDGFAGLASQVVRHSSTADRQLVARLAALLIDQDFGLAGTLDLERIQADRIDVKLKGGGLGVPLEHWVRKDQVFAVTQLLQGSGPQQRALRMPWILLQVVEDPRGETCHCRLLHNTKDPLPRGRGILGYRCLKLGTTRAPLRLRLVKNDKLRTPLTSVQVSIGVRRFDPDPANVRERIPPKPDGLVVSEFPYDHVAFVMVYDGPKGLAGVPVEIIEGQTITCPVSVSAETAAQAELLRRREQWLGRVYESLEVANNLVKELNAMKGQSSESALTLAQGGLKTIRSNIDKLTEERESLRADAAKELLRAARLDLADGEEGLQQLQKLRDNLQGFIEQLKANITKEKDPIRQKWNDLVAKAGLLEGNAEFGKAIELYKEVLAEGADDPKVRKHLEALERAWTPKSKAHEKARAFLYGTWSNLETAAQLNARLELARQAFATCQDAGDFLSPQKLLKTYATHNDRLVKEAEALHPEEKEDDREKAKQIIDLTEKLKQFKEEVKEYLSKAPPLEK